MADLYPVYLALRTIMLKAAPSLSIGKDALGEFTANVPDDIMAKRDPVWFGSVRLNPTHVAYYLPPLAAREGRDIVVPERLKKHAQTRTCFIFHDVDQDLFAELEAVTRAAAQGYRQLAA
ncbi:MAG: hypothetical protein ACXU8U_09390 [Asticcacaulis sp.]